VQFRSHRESYLIVYDDGQCDFKLLWERAKAEAEAKGVDSSLNIHATRR
jgi:hypothetical protein